MLRSVLPGKGKPALLDAKRFNEIQVNLWPYNPIHEDVGAHVFAPNRDKTRLLRPFIATCFKESVALFTSNYSIASIDDEQQGSQAQDLQVGPSRTVVPY